MIQRTTLFLTLFLVLSAPLLLRAQGILYVGNTRVDLDFGHNNEPGVDKVEIYRDKPTSTKIGEMVNGGSGIVYYSDKNLSKGTRYYYSLKKYKSDNTTQTVGLGFVTTGEVRGYLLTDEQWDSEVVIMDSVVVVFGTLTLNDGTDIKPGTRQIWTKINVGSAGKMIANGGKLADVNVDIFGIFSPIQNITLAGTIILLHNPVPTLVNGAILQEDNPTDKVPVYLYSPDNMIEARKAVIRGASELKGVALAESCIVEPYSTLTATVARYCRIKADAFLALRPNTDQTICEFNTFDSSQVGVSQMSIVQNNTFRGYASVLVSATSAGFPPDQVADIHITHNAFLKEGGEVAFLSNTDADSVDARLNYWGDYCGPDQPQRFARAFFDPFLRVPYPQPSYWSEIKPDKRSIIANNQDKITFSGKIYEVLSGVPAKDSLVTYFATCGGDTVAKGSVNTGPDGRVSFSIVLPNKYSAYSNLFVRVWSIQGIGQCLGDTWLIDVGSATGPDLVIDSVQVIQVQATTPGIIDRKRFAVKVDISTSDVVPDSFQVALSIGGNFYTRFYKLARPNIDLDFTLKNFSDQIALPNGESYSLYFFPDVADLGPGPHTVEATIDPPDASHPNGRILEANEDNNTRSTTVTVKSIPWGNEAGAQNLTLLFQPFETDIAALPRFNLWSDSAIVFMRKVFPMDSTQLVTTQANDVLFPSPKISPPALLDTTFESFLAKAYKLLRIQKPDFDRYVLAAPDDWFFRRIDPYEFDNRLSNSLSWSGIPDMVLARVNLFKSPVHELGHTFGLRRTDIGEAEEYQLFNVGKQVTDGLDADTRGIKEYGLPSFSNTTEEVYCFMSNSLPNYGRLYWICDEDYAALYNGVRQFFRTKSALSKQAGSGGAMLVTGVVDSLGGMRFGAWATLTSATFSPMSDSATSPWVFKVLDASNNLLARYFYRPTFTARSVDEGFTPAPRLLEEYFDLVLPFPTNAVKITAVLNGTEVVSRSVTPNPPAVEFLSPSAARDTVFNTDFSIKWKGTDPDGGQLFYTVYWSSDGGSTWTMYAMDITEEQLDYQISKVGKGSNYRIKIEVSDGILTGSAVSRRFTVDSDVPVGPLAPPVSFELRQNYPNPFQEFSTIEYELYTAAEIRLEVVDMLGRTVRTLVQAHRDPGRYVERIDGNSLVPGAYMIRLRAGDRQEMRRMAVIR